MAVKGNEGQYLWENWHFVGIITQSFGSSSVFFRAVGSQDRSLLLPTSAKRQHLSPDDSSGLGSLCRL